MTGHPPDARGQTRTVGGADSTAGASLRHWLPVAGAALVIASLVPPLSTLARRYLWAESFQFSIFAMVGPALIVLGAPWRSLGLSRRADRASPGWAEAPLRLADRLAASRDRRPSFLRAAAVLAGFIGVSLAWRLPPVLAAVARLPGLVAAEAITLLAAGIGLWLELVRSPPLAPRLSGPHRAAIAAFAMWSTWIVAYALGFASSPVIAGYAGTSGPGAVADQEIAAGLVWGVAGVCFLPVIFGGLFSWLKEGGDIGEELGRELQEAPARAGVRGWNSPPRKRGASAG
jgi:cytochrome c oxidase assembly factor CtaG